MTEGVLLLVVVLGIGWYGWTHITFDPPRRRHWVICKGGMTHFDDKVLIRGDEGAMRSHTMCPECLDYWNAQLENTPRKFAA